MLFVDTWAWRAMAFPRDDPWRDKAGPAWKKVARDRPELFTTSLVYAEAINTVAHHATCAAAALFSTLLLATPSLRVIRVSDEIEKEGVDLMRRFGDQQFTLTDAVSMAVMRRLHVRRVFTGDADFRTAGFETFPT
jgi:predicted nucleic acid-binding protein